MRSVALALLVGATTLEGQVAPNRNTQYLFPAEPGDARAIWLNPGALGLAGTLSVALDLTVTRPGPGGHLGQLSAGFTSRHFSFGYQRDRLSDTLTGHTYRLALWGSDARLGAGLAAAVYRGGDGGTGWDLGAVYRLHPRITVGGVLGNIGQPVVRGARLRVQLVPGVSLHTPDGRLALSGQGVATPDSVLGFAAGFRAALPLRWPVRLLARVDTDRSARRTALAFGMSVGGLDQVGLLVTTPGDASEIGAASLYGVSARRLAPSRR